MADALDVELAALAVRTSTGAGTGVDIGALRSVLVLTLEVTAASGGDATLDVVVETSTDDSSWVEVAAFEQVNAVGFDKLTFAGLQRYARASWVISGTGSPSFTFGVAGQAHVVYATPADLSALALPSAAYSSVGADVVAGALLAATDEADGYVGAAYTLPLAAWGVDLTRHVSAMAAYGLMSQRGYSPETGVDERIRLGREDAVEWLRRLADGRLLPPGMVDSTPEEHDDGVFVVSGATRGWEDWG